jgi:hypothetical protein
MEDKNLVTDVTENVEQATEELVDGAKVEVEHEPTTEAPLAETFTKEQVDEMIAKKLARKEAKIRKEYDKKYGRLENVLKAGTGVENVEEMADTFTDFYTKKGIQIPSTPQYSEREMQILADAEANDIISSGYDDIVEEVDRLADIGADNMTPQEKMIFSKLAKERTRIESEKELASIGVTKIEDDFKEFANKLNPSLSMKEKYEMYVQLNPKKKGEMIGSMKSNTMKDNGVKEFYTYDEAIKFTKADFDKNPALFKAVENSMTKW